MSLLHKNTSSTIRTLYSQCIESLTSHDAIEQSLQADLQTHLQELKLELPDPEYQLLKNRAVAFAELGQEAGFVRGFKVAFRLFVECMDE